MFVKNRSNILKPHFYIIRNSKGSKSAHTLHSSPKQNTNASLLPFSFFLCSMHFNSLTGSPAIRTVKCCKTLTRIKKARNSYLTTMPTRFMRDSEPVACDKPQIVRWRDAVPVKKSTLSAKY